MKSIPRAQTLMMGLALALSMGWACANSTVPQEGVRADMAKDFVATLLRYNNGQIPDSWSEVAESGLFVLGSNSLLPVGKGISDTYSFVAASDRGKFPDGELILIGYHPLPWPEVWKSELADTDLTTLTEEQRAEVLPQIERDQNRSKPIRYLIIRNTQGNLRSEWWYEDKVQAMLKETGITIPRPTPYYPKGPDGEYLPLTPEAIAALVRLDLTDTIPPELATRMRASGTLPAPRPPRPPGATTPDVASPPAPASTLAHITATPWVGWAVALVVIIAATLYLRHQQKRGR